MQNQKDLNTASVQDHTTPTFPEARHGWLGRWKSPEIGGFRRQIFMITSEAFLLRADEARVRFSVQDFLH